MARALCRVVHIALILRWPHSAQCECGDSFNDVSWPPTNYSFYNLAMNADFFSYGRCTLIKHRIKDEYPMNCSTLVPKIQISVWSCLEIGSECLAFTGDKEPSVPRHQNEQPLSLDRMLSNTPCSILCRTDEFTSHQITQGFLGVWELENLTG